MRKRYEDGLVFTILAIFTPIFLFVTAIIAFPARTVAVVVVTAPFLAIIAVLLAAAVVPDRVRHDVEGYDGVVRVVAGDDEFATSRAFFRGLVADQDIQARSGMERCREGVVDQAPVPALTFEGNAGHVQLAVANVADRDRSLGTATGPDAAEAGRSGDGDLPGGCAAIKRDAFSARWVVAADVDHHGLPAAVDD